jgi:hypothetical protein
MTAPSKGLVDPQGRPLTRVAVDETCPRCGKGEDDRHPSGGFGQPWTVCVCGYEWKDRPWHG